jgi:hypothetical protein
VTSESILDFCNVEVDNVGVDTGFLHVEVDTGFL